MLCNFGYYVHLTTDGSRTAAVSEEKTTLVVWAKIRRKSNLAFEMHSGFKQFDPYDS